jgi:phage baseplate assembly protein W
MEQKTDRSFLGTGWGFPPTFSRRTYSVEMLTGGERVMLPNFGCNLQPFVFETMSPATIALIKKIVFEALSFHEPRIIVGDIVELVKQKEGILELDIPYTIVATNTRYNYVYLFYLNEATNIEHG